MVKNLISIVIAIALGIGIAWWAVQKFTPTTAVSYTSSTQAQGGDFVMESAQQRLQLHDYRGKVVLVYFGYTACPDICPTSMATMKAGLDALNPTELAQVQGIFISVDPERDTPKHVHEYAQFFHPSIVGGTSTAENIAAITQKYAVFYRKVPLPNSAMGYTMDHSTAIYVIDKNGTLREQVEHTLPADKMAATIRRYL